MESAVMADGEQNRDMEVAPALISVHPSEHSVAVAVGSDLRIFDLQSNNAVCISSEILHKDSIRAICYGADGKLFVSAGDDKLVKIWSTNPWNCLYTVSSEKRVSAVAVSNDGRFVCYADKFGVVSVVDLEGFQENQSPTVKKGVPLLAHYCSIITSLEFSPDGRFIVTADPDFKIRVSVVPKKPLDGAHEIQCFCLGHTEFVSCISFVFPSAHPEGLLVSGSGDSTVRLWDITSGSLLDTCLLGAEAEVTKYIVKEEENYPAITDLCAIPNSSLVAVAIQSLSGVVLLNCNLPTKTLSVAKVVSVVGEAFIPTSLTTSLSGNIMWMVTGVSNLKGCDTTSLARVRVVSGLNNQPTVLEDKDIPGGVELLEKLQGRVSIENEVFLAAAESVKTAMHNLLIKKQYSLEKRDFRKRGRNDRKPLQPNE